MSDHGDAGLRWRLDTELARVHALVVGSNTPE